MIPRHERPLQKVPQTKVHPTRTYRHRERERFGEHDPHESRIAEQFDGLGAMEQRVRHILMTERYEFAIYPPTYGIELQKYHKRPYGYFRATIEQTLGDALMQDDRIRGVTVSGLGKIDPDAAYVDFEVHTDIGRMAFRAEVAT